MDPLMYVLDLIVFIGIFAILSLSLNLEYGFAGLGNFGKVAFFLVGAYTYAILIHLGLPFPPCLVIASLVAGIFGLLVSLPALRLREDYLAIATLAFGEILRLIVKAEHWIAGGVWGITVPVAISWEGASTRGLAFVDIGLVYFCLLICFLLVQFLTNSPYGRVVRALREDEVAAEALGKDTFKYKAQIFMLGSGLAGLAGALYAQHLRFIDPYMFMPMVTFWVWIMIFTGGPANNYGSLIGAVLVETFVRGARIAKDYLTLPIDPHNLQFILLGLLILFILLYRPQGMLKESQVKTKAQEIVLAWKKHS